MEAGSIIGGRYQLVAAMEEGGLSTVWQGVARSSEVFARPVAIKVMKREFSRVDGPYLSMLLEEARIGARLQHSNLVQVIDFITEATARGPIYCLVMEWIDGLNLKALSRVEQDMKRPLQWPLVATVGLRVLRGSAVGARALRRGWLSRARHPPRRLAPEHPDRAQRRREAWRFRDGARSRSDSRAHRTWVRKRHAGLHGARDPEGPASHAAQ